MDHETIYSLFKLLFPELIKLGVEWFPNGLNSIRIRNVDETDMIFTYHCKEIWELESVKSYILKLNGRLSDD